MKYHSYTLMKLHSITVVVFGFLCLSSNGQTSFLIDFETDDQGAVLEAGSVDLGTNEPYRNIFGSGSGVTLSTDSPTERPLNLYDTEGTGGLDPDLERNSTGSGQWAGGSNLDLMVGNVLIINTNTDLGTPNDYGFGGVLTFDFDVQLSEFGFHFIDLDSATNGSVTFADGLGNSTTLQFEDFEETSTYTLPATGASFATTGVSFGNRFANEISEITASDLGLSSFNSVTFNLTGSGAIGTVFGTTLVTVPETSSSCLVMFSVILLASRRKR
ncbi:MAG: hypothetical protein ACSHX7_03035 [Luteolibacter sp.]